MRFVLQMHNALAEVGEAMALVTDHSRTRKLLSLTGIDQSVRIFKTRRAAIAWTGNQKESVPGGAAPSLNAAINVGTVHCLPRFSMSGARFAGTGLRAYAKGRSEVAPNGRPGSGVSPPGALWGSVRANPVPPVPAQPWTAVLRRSPEL